MASTEFDLSAANYVTKQLYNGQDVMNMVVNGSPALSFLPKMTEFVGESLPIPVEYAPSQGRSAAFATAQSNTTALAGVKFLLTRVKNYSVAQLDRETMKATATNAGAFAAAVKRVTDQAIRVMRNTICSQLFRSGTGSIGQISTITSGVIQLVNIPDAQQFWVNQTLQAASSDGGSPRAALGYVIAVDRGAGTVTVASSGLGGSAGTPSGWTTSDYLLVQGDSNLAASGFLAWVPTTAPTSTAFYSVNRSVDTLLGGTRYDGSSLSIQEALVNAAVQVFNQADGAPNLCFMNPISFAALEQSLGGQVRYENMQSPAGVGFNAIKIRGPQGEIAVIPDRNCPSAKAFLIESDTWQVCSLDGLPHIIDDDGITWRRVENEDSGELRVAAYWNLACKAPGRNCNVTLGA